MDEKSETERDRFAFLFNSDWASHDGRLFCWWKLSMERYVDALSDDDVIDPAGARVPRTRFYKLTSFFLV